MKQHVIFVQLVLLYFKVNVHLHVLLLFQCRRSLQVDFTLQLSLVLQIIFLFGINLQSIARWLTDSDLPVY